MGVDIDVNVIRKTRDGYEEVALYTFDGKDYNRILCYSFETRDHKLFDKIVEQLPLRGMFEELPTELIEYYGDDYNRSWFDIVEFVAMLNSKVVSKRVRNWMREIVNFVEIVEGIGCKFVNPGEYIVQFGFNC